MRCVCVLTSVFYFVHVCVFQIMDHGAPVQWDDIAGLQFAKGAIKEIVVWPMLRPLVIKLYTTAVELLLHSCLSLSLAHTQ